MTNYPYLISSFLLGKRDTKSAFLTKSGLKCNYSTKSRKNNLDLLKKVESPEPLMIKGNFITDKVSKNSLNIVENFLKKYPSFELASANINYNLIFSIFKGHIKDFQLSEKVFNLLLSLKDPIIFDKLPLDNIGRAYFREVIGITKRGINSCAGVYIFTNKINGKHYVGSSLTLSSRLSDDYLRKGIRPPKIYFWGPGGGGGRAIELAIKKYGLSNFKLEIYIFSDKLKDQVFEGKVDNDNWLEYKKVMKNLVLVFEQIFILRLNPEYNELKIAGINVGLKVTTESMLPRLKKTRKVTYFFDSVKKELIYIADSRTDLAVALGMSRIIENNKLYLNRYFISNEMLNEKEYSINLLDPKELATSINEVRAQIMEKVSKNFIPYKEAVRDKLSKSTELINTQTNEVKVLPSLQATVNI